MDKLDAFTITYITAALWLSVDDNGSPLDKNYSMNDIATPSLEKMINDCRNFQAQENDLLEKAQLQSDLNYTDEQAGHDFWLTRNRHGAGFWDRGLGIIGKDLTFAAHAAGECSLYVGDDGKIYIGL